MMAGFNGGAPPVKTLFSIELSEAASTAAGVGMAFKVSSVGVLVIQSSVQYTASAHMHVRWLTRCRRRVGTSRSHFNERKSA